MTDRLPHSSHPQSRTLARILEAKGIRNAVLSPGSRNAPLALELAASSLQCFSIVDERSAAFFALGLSKEQGIPAAAVCTSGSAVLNYYPAVAEAYYSRIPLIVISADRPAQWTDQAIGQTIRQDGVLTAHTVYSASLREGADAQTAWYNAREINRTVGAALRESAPAHINIPLSEPLYDTLQGDFPSPKIIEELGTNPVLSRESEKEILRLWRSAGRKMILVGAHRRDEHLQNLLGRLARESDTAVLCETTSNLHSPDFIGYIDRTVLPLTAEAAAAFHPDLLITCGGMVVSKKIKTFLRNAAPPVHIHVSRYAWPDTYMSLTHRADTDPAGFFPLLCGAECRDTGYAAAWRELAAKRERSHRDYCVGAPYSDFKVWEALSAALPQGTHLEVANSAAIRYNQLFPVPQGVTVGCNRGTSGIDGSSSTAVGAAVALAPRPVTFVGGDLSFLYDNNALWNAYIPSTMRIVVVNNGGGGIFRILNGARTSPIGPQYLQAGHSLNVEPLARLHGLEYRSADSLTALQKELEHFWTPSDRPRLLEVFTRSADNDAVLRNYFAAL